MCARDRGPCMRLTDAQRARVRRLLGSNSTRFVDLAQAAELDPASDFREADLRRIDFGTDDLTGFDLRGADLRGANLSRARGVTPEMLKDAIFDATTRGFVLRDFPNGPEMVLIPPGTFLMGVPEKESEREKDTFNFGNARPVHRVTIARPFWLARYPLTRGQFAAFAKATRHTDKDWQKPRFKQTPAHPVANVSHEDAMAYVAWASERSAKTYRLPSEAEWEYAARAGTTTARYWGESRDDQHLYANGADESLRRAEKADPDPDGYLPADDGHARTSPVGTYRPNAFGLFDMLGNVWEWCADPWHDNYDGAPGDSSVWETNGDSLRRVLRGGSWISSPGNLRAGVRNAYDGGLRGSVAGVRPARTSF